MASRDEIPGRAGAVTAFGAIALRPESAIDPDRARHVGIAELSYQGLEFLIINPISGYAAIAKFGPDLPFRVHGIV